MDSRERIVAHAPQDQRPAALLVCTPCRRTIPVASLPDPRTLLDARPVPPRTIAEQWLDLWRDVGMYVWFRAQSRRS
jgi:hypothetical protein